MNWFAKHEPVRKHFIKKKTSSSIKTTLVNGLVRKARTCSQAFQLSQQPLQLRKPFSFNFKA